MTAALPPEVSSAIIHSGPGSSSLTEAAQTWQAIAEELERFAQGYQGALSGLAGVWTGPSASAMNAAAASYMAWIAATATQARQTAMSATVAAAAFNMVRATITPPAAVAANRTQLAALIATNILGQNAAAIAATEAEYGQMWATNTVAFTGYQAESSQALAQVSQFAPAPQTTTPAPLQELQNLVGSGGVIQTLLTRLADPTTPLGFLNQYALAFVSSGVIAELPLGLLSMLSVLWVADSPNSPLAAHGAPVPEISVTPATPPTTMQAPSVRVAGPGAAPRLGPLSVPPNWATTAPDRAQLVRPLTPAETSVPVAVPMPMPLPIGGVSRTGTPPKEQKPPPEYGALVRFVPRPPSGG